jgi:uncharacterized membrane protein YfcA
MTTAGSYALSGLVDWGLAGLFVIGGALGGALGIALGQRLSRHKRLLALVFATLVVSVGTYVTASALMRL